MAHGLRVDVSRQHERRARPTRLDDPDDIRAVRKRVLEIDVVEAHALHAGEKRVRELALLALDARDTNDLLCQCYGIRRVDELRDGFELRGCRGDGQLDQI